MNLGEVAAGAGRPGHEHHVLTPREGHMASGFAQQALGSISLGRLTNPS